MLRYQPRSLSFNVPLNVISRLAVPTVTGLWTIEPLRGRLERERGVVAVHLHVVDVQVGGVEDDLFGGVVDVQVDDHMAGEGGRAEIGLECQRVPMGHDRRGRR